MRHLLTAIFILINSTVLASNQTQAADSLLGVLKNTQSSEKRIQIYRNLADLYQENPEAHLYLLKMYQEAATIDDRKNMLNALDDILIAGISEYNKDTIAKYTEYFKKIATEDELKSLLPFYHMRTFDSRCYSGERTEAIKEELDSKNVETDKEDNVYKQIASAKRQYLIWIKPCNLQKHSRKKKNTSTKNSLPGEYVLHTPKLVRTKKL